MFRYNNFFFKPAICLYFTKLTISWPRTFSMPRHSSEITSQLLILLFTICFLHIHSDTHISLHHHYSTYTTPFLPVSYVFHPAHFTHWFHYSLITVPFPHFKYPSTISTLVPSIQNKSSDSNTILSTFHPSDSWVDQHHRRAHINNRRAHTYQQRFT